jgi:hypothetical protein
MDALKTHKNVIDNYRSYLSSFLFIQAERIKKSVTGALDDDQRSGSLDGIHFAII